MFRNCRRFLSLGFAGPLIQPQPTGGIGQPVSQNLLSCKNAIVQQISKHMPVLSVSHFSLCHSNWDDVIVMQSSNSRFMLNDISNRHHCNLSHCVSSRGLKIWSKNFLSPNQKDSGSSELEKDASDDCKDVSLEEDDESKMTILQRFKSTYKKHGKTLLAVHCATSVVWFGCFYYVARR